MNFKLGLSTSEADVQRVTIQSASFSNIFFHSHSHWQKPLQKPWSCITLVNFTIFWAVQTKEHKSSMWFISCAFYSANKMFSVTILFLTHVYPCWFLIKIKGTDFISKYAQVQKEMFEWENAKTFLYFPFLPGWIFFSIFENLSSVGLKNRKLIVLA